jgi:hypothetical protein
MIEIAPVGQDHDGDWSAVPISGQDSQCDGFPERQTRGELFGAIAERLARFGAVDSPKPDARWLVVQEDSDRVAVGNAGNAGFDIPGGGRGVKDEQDGKQGGKAKRTHQELETYRHCRRVAFPSGSLSSLSKSPQLAEKLVVFIPLLSMPTNIEVELLRQNEMLRGAIIFAMDKIRQMRAGQKVDATAVLETLGRQLSEARATNEELFAGLVAPELVRVEERESQGG